MKNLIIILTIAGTVTFCSNSRATITNASWSATGNPIVNASYGWNAGSDLLTMSGQQQFVPTDLAGQVQTDTVSDPTLFLGGSVNNDTSFAWTTYQVNVYMAVPFNFTGTPGVSNPSSDWYVGSVVQPSTPLLTGPYAGDYEGTLNFSDGTPLAIGAELDFNYAIHFSGSTDYAFTQEMIPNAVPEPSALGLLAVSGPALAMLWRSKRKSA